mgnify:FL=1
MPEHTPGPWRVQRLDDEPMIVATGGRFEVVTDAFDVCAYIPASGPIRREADARLIAAAPELLAALEGCLGYFAWMMEQQTDHLTSGAAYAPDAAWLQPIRAAIAKSKE